MNAKTGDMVKYTLLPGVIPRVHSFFTSGFSLVAGLMACIYNILGLLPNTHPYLNPKNYGRFGIINVISEAGKNLTFSKEHIDQVIVYFTILIGFILICVQFILLGMALVSTSAFASGFPAMSWDIFTVTPAGHTSTHDLAFMVLDNVFGAMNRAGTLGFFESCVSDTGTDCINSEAEIVPSPTIFPLPMHLALHQMLYFYGSGIAFIAFIVILYFVVTIIGETVTSGTPFGQRFNKAWFVPRLLVFFILIAPMATAGPNAGISWAQWLTLNVAKYGSNMATNVWLGFVDSTPATSDVSSFLAQEQSFLARPNIPEIGHLTQFMYMVKMCMVAEKIMHNRDVKIYLVREPQDPPPSGNVTLPDGSVVPFGNMGLPAPYNAGDAADITSMVTGFNTLEFEEAVRFSRYSTVVVRFGVQDSALYKTEWGKVEPTCGELQFELTALDPFIIGNRGNPLSATEGGIQFIYFENVLQMLDPGIGELADKTVFCMLEAILPVDHRPDCANGGYNLTGAFGVTVGPNPAAGQGWLTAEAARSEIELFNIRNSSFVTGEWYDWTTYNYVPSWDLLEQIDIMNPAYVNNMLITPQLRARGWSGAALWFNQISEVNGSLFTAVQNLPRPYKYPKVMEEVAQQHVMHDSNVAYTHRFNPRLQDGKMAELRRPGDQYLASALYNAYRFWSTAAVQETVYIKGTDNVILDVLNMILGTSGLFDMIKNTDVHPLAQLTGLGKSMTDAAIRNMFAGIVGQGIGKLLSENFVGQMAGVAGDFAFKFGMIGIAIGFMLYYVLPLMPFIYFFFAFSGWVKSIFEAVVAMPLWALAHIRIDGEGLPGPMATNGYFLLFEIFLRPTLILSGFILSFVLFSALVSVLNDIFVTVVYVVGGSDVTSELFGVGIDPTTGNLAAGQRPPGTFEKMSGPIDEFFYTAIYAIIVYMIGLSCFKLVDMIPDSIMRWMGVTVSTFQENAGDPAGEMAGKMYRGVRMGNVQVQSLMRGGSGRSVTNEMMANQMA